MDITWVSFIFMHAFYVCILHFISHLMWSLLNTTTAIKKHTGKCKQNQTLILTHIRIKKNDINKHESIMIL